MKRVAGYHYTANKTSISFLGTILPAIGVSKEPLKDLGYLEKPVVVLKDYSGNAVIPPNGHMSFSMVDIHGDVIDRAVNIVVGWQVGPL